MGSKGIVFYDFKAEDCDIEALYHKIRPYADIFHVEWTSMGWSGRRKMLHYNHNKLLKVDFNKIDSVGIYGGQQEKGTNNLYKIAAEIEQRYRHFTFCYADKGPINKEFFVNVIKDIAPILDFQYGIIAESDRGPINAYFDGTIQGDISKEEAERTTKWRNEYLFEDGDYRTGDLRDIYPFNILTEAHLTRDVGGGKNLRQWIESSSDHGELEKVTDRHWLWSVPDEKIPAIQEALDPSGILLCYKV